MKEGTVQLRREIDMPPPYDEIYDLIILSIIVVLLRSSLFPTVNSINDKVKLRSNVTFNSESESCFRVWGWYVQHTNVKRVRSRFDISGVVYEFYNS